MKQKKLESDKRVRRFSRIMSHQDGIKVMELGDLDLLTAVENGLLSLEERKRIYISLFEGLSLLQELDRVHGDIKPENIVLKNSEAQFIDFDDVTTPGKQQRLFGTLGFIDPYYLITKNFTFSSDLWSLMCTICMLEWIAQGRNQETLLSKDFLQVFQTYWTASEDPSKMAWLLEKQDNLFEGLSRKSFFEHIVYQLAFTSPEKRPTLPFLLLSFLFQCHPGQHKTISMLLLQKTGIDLKKHQILSVSPQDDTYLITYCQLKGGTKKSVAVTHDKNGGYSVSQTFSENPCSSIWEVLGHLPEQLSSWSSFYGFDP